MTPANAAITGLVTLAGLTLLGLLFAMYQNPLFEIYLAEWGLC